MALSSWRTVQIQPFNDRDDMEKFLLVKFKESAKSKAHADRDHLVKVLAHNANGVILWAKLMMNEVELGRWKM
jgi:hypothetical protein